MTAAWDQLVSLSVTGLAGKPIPLDGYHPLISHHLGQQHTDSIDGTYEIAALMTVAGRAGVQPAPAVDPLPPAPTDELPEVSPALTELLCSAMESNQRVTSWALREIATRERRVPIQLIPRLLQLAGTHKQDHAEITAILGRRGQWVAGVAGVGYVDDSDDSLWTHGSLSQREGWLSALRRRDPESARRTLEAVWAKEKAADRESLLAALEPGLSLADEAFLEQALDDRAKGVRSVAAQFLAKLPGSALQQRMTERTRSIISARKRLGRLTIHIALPDELDEQAARDGIDTGQAPSGTGRSVWLLRQILSKTPLLPALTESLRASPRDIVRALPEEFAADIIEPLAHQTARANDATWALALVRHDACPDVVVSALPDPQRSEFVERRLAQANVQHGEILTSIAAPWPPRICAAAVKRLSNEVNTPTATGWRWSEYTRELEINLPVGQHDPWIKQLVDLQAEAAETWSVIFTRLIDALTLRSAITKELP
ncbi:DUF5691 domain-containing protein [Mycobacteroides salmoniphilum]|uniref:DUF5691 domain-containing protein n=1 Tax=Mycobacteroides salmoniphilum TaxID=404941 RepID=UPI001066CCF2|nr:DUF5691 domain-containing protein [Mycobacteroides salmoniphilum]TDZ93979.1 hypothetical protein CCUG62472_02163 [Mycobacteroides salmoniphilum]